MSNQAIESEFVFKYSPSHQRFIRVTDKYQELMNSLQKTISNSAFIERLAQEPEKSSMQLKARLLSFVLRSNEKLIMSNIYGILHELQNIQLPLEHYTLLFDQLNAELLRINKTFEHSHLRPTTELKEQLTEIRKLLEENLALTASSASVHDIDTITSNSHNCYRNNTI